MILKVGQSEIYNMDNLYFFKLTITKSRRSQCCIHCGIFNIRNS